LADQNATFSIYLISIKYHSVGRPAQCVSPPASVFHPPHTPSSVVPPPHIPASVDFVGKVKLTIVDFRKLTIVDFNQLTEKSRTKRTKRAV
jgi:hypothetical protein